MGLISGSGRYPGGGHGNPYQYSCLETPMDGGAWCSPGSGISFEKSPKHRTLGVERQQQLENLEGEQRCLKCLWSSSGSSGHRTTQMNYTEASASPQHSFSETEKTEANAESTETEHECLATSCVPSTGDVHSTAACRVLEGTRATPVTAADFFLP